MSVSEAVEVGGEREIETEMMWIHPHGVVDDEQQQRVTVGGGAAGELPDLPDVSSPTRSRGDENV